jgi:DNA-binding LacI/PurR family transcriptional regulator
MVTSKDVARLAGVSQSTVSYVMSGRRSISDSTRRRVEAAIDQLAYQPNAGARALKSQRTQVIGLVVPFGPSVDTTGMLPFIETIASCARDEDYDVLLVTGDEGSAGLTRLAARSLCDAVVLMDIEARDARIPVAASLTVPVILIGVPHDSAGLHCVDLDFELAGRMAVNELVELAHDRVVLVGQPPELVARDINFVRRFEQGAVGSAAAHGLRCDRVGPVERGRGGAEAAVAQGLAGGGDRLGFVVPHSQAIQPIVQALLHRGVVPGRDVSVIGLCTDAMAEASTPSITNVSLEPRDVSRRAMCTLFGLLDREQGPPSETTELVAPRLTRRQTTLPARTVPR